MDTNQAIQYILSQTRENISFLESTQQISPDVARDILSKLPSNGTNTGNHVPVPATLALVKSPSNPLVTRPPPPIPSKNIVKAKALWGYNEDHKEPKDLTFYAGDIIDIVDDKNPDWWTGRLNGREGLFPSSYVEKLLRDVPSLPPRRNSPNYMKPPMPHNFPTGPPPPHGYSTPAPYPYQPQNSYYAPPPPQNGPYPPYQNVPPGPPAQGPPQTVVVTENQGGKKHGFLSGGLGNTLAHSAAGGVGFGAGSAVGSGIINSIF